jgi:hypothetical protein
MNGCIRHPSITHVTVRYDRSDLLAHSVLALCVRTLLLTCAKMVRILKINDVKRAASSRRKKVRLRALCMQM